MTALLDDTSTCTEALRRYLAADSGDEVGDIIDIVRGVALRRSDLRQLLRAFYDQSEVLLRLALDFEPEYGVELEIPEEQGRPHQVVYRCTTLADAQAKAAASLERTPGAPQPPRVTRRFVGPWAPYAADAR